MIVLDETLLPSSSFNVLDMSTGLLGPSSWAIADRKFSSLGLNTDRVNSMTYLSVSVFNLDGQLIDKNVTSLFYTFFLPFLFWQLSGGIGG